MTPGVVGGPDGVTPGWLTEVFRADGAIGDASAVTGLQSKSIGTGQVGDNVRFELDYEGPAGPASVVCKFGSSDPASAAAGVSMHLYETEVAFYSELADTVDVARPHCYFAAVTPGTADAVLVMEDLAPAVQGDQISGCSVAEAERAAGASPGDGSASGGGTTIGARGAVSGSGWSNSCSGAGQSADSRWPISPTVRSTLSLGAACSPTPASSTPTPTPTPTSTPASPGSSPWSSLPAETELAGPLPPVS